MKKTQRTLGICVSTCYPNRVFDYIFSDTSLHQIAQLKDYSLLINAQDFSRESIDRLTAKLEMHNIDFHLVQNAYHFQTSIPINKIRHDCAEILSCKFYYIVDDDVMLLPGWAKEIEDGLTYMKNFRCGIISYRSRAPRKPVEVPITEKGVISPMPWDARYNTANGLLIRNIDYITHQGSIMPNDTILLVGGGEEKIFAGYQLFNGFFGACMQKVSSKNERCIHVRDKGWDSENILMSNNDGYIKTHWNSEFDGYHSYNIVKYEDFLAKGGQDILRDMSKFSIKFK